MGYTRLFQTSVPTVVMSAEEWHRERQRRVGRPVYEAIEIAPDLPTEPCRREGCTWAIAHEAAACREKPVDRDTPAAARRRNAKRDYVAPYTVLRHEMLGGRPMAIVECGVCEGHDEQCAACNGLGEMPLFKWHMHRAKK